MLKPFTNYQIEMQASVASGIAAQLLCYNNTRFVGRIDFHINETLPKSYLWHPTGTTDPDSIYIVLIMPIDRLQTVIDVVRNEAPLALEIWPLGPLFGAATDGYGGVLRSTANEPVGEGERAALRAARP